MDNLEYIEAYFNDELSPEEKEELEQKIIADPVFAEEIAFYLSSKQVIAATTMEQRERFKEIYTTYNANGDMEKQPLPLVRKLWPWAAVAAVLAGIILGWYAWFKPLSPDELAVKYIKENFQTLPVTMGNKEDSLETALRLYNEARLEEALLQFESMTINDTSLFEAKKYAGIVSLRLEQYDKAIAYFSQLESYSQLYANPGKFYHALTLMKRNGPGDSEAARQLLQEIVQKDMEGKKFAEQWLKKW